MAKVKKIRICRECRKILHCASCGARQTPNPNEWAAIPLRVKVDLKKMLKEYADKEGISVNEYIREKLTLMMMKEDEGME